MITPQEYLTNEGGAIFKEIVKSLNGVTEEIDTYELSMLANSYDLYHRNAEILNGSTQLPVLDQTRIAALMDKAWRQIEKQSDKFGMNPIGRDKLSKIAKPQKKDSKLAKYIINDPIRRLR